MKSLISRESYRPDKRYSGVYHIQGGMVTDADLDERSRITQDRTDNLGNDTEVFPLLTYHLALQNFRLGEGAALPIMMLPIIAFLVLGVASYMDREATE